MSVVERARIHIQSHMQVIFSRQGVSHSFSCCGQAWHVVMTAVSYSRAFRACSRPLAVPSASKSSRFTPSRRVLLRALLAHSRRGGDAEAMCAPCPSAPPLMCTPAVGQEAVTSGSAFGCWGTGAQIVTDKVLKRVQNRPRQGAPCWQDFTIPDPSRPQRPIPAQVRRFREEPCDDLGRQGASRHIGFVRSCPS